MATRRRLPRFTRTERTFHWVNATGFFLLLATGLILYLPSLAIAVGRRPLIKDIHFWGGVGWLVALALVAVAGDGRGLLRAARDVDDPAGRFNLGQRVSVGVTAASTILFAVSGLLLWLGERNTAFRFTSNVLLHDTLMFGMLALVLGHLYLAVIHPATRHALRGITLGDVDEEWAARHHPEWVERPEFRVSTKA